MNDTKPALDALQKAMNRSRHRMLQHVAAGNREKQVEQEKRHMEGLFQAVQIVLNAQQGAEAPGRRRSA